MLKFERLEQEIRDQQRLLEANWREFHFRKRILKNKFRADTTRLASLTLGFLVVLSWLKFSRNSVARRSRKLTNVIGKGLLSLKNIILSTLMGIAVQSLQSAKRSAVLVLKSDQ